MKPAAAWPYPDDDELTRSRRVALAYRAQLQDSAPARCRELDALMERWAQTWVLPRLRTVGDDDWLSVGEAAALVHRRPATLRQWRHRGRLIGRFAEGRWWYRAGDLRRVRGAS